MGYNEDLYDDLEDNLMGEFNFDSTENSEDRDLMSSLFDSDEDDS